MTHDTHSPERNNEDNEDENKYLPYEDGVEEESEEEVVYKTPDGKHSYFIHFIYESNLKHMKKEVLKKDYDGFIVIDGQEGFGKTTLAMQTALYLDPTFNLDRVVFTMDDFIEAAENAKKGEAIVFDETMGYLSARGAMSSFNRKLIKVFSEMRSRNLFIILNIPSFFELDKYPAIHRSTFLCHVYRRGFFGGYNYVKKKNLYIFGKKYYSYSNPKANFIGKFPKYFPFDKAEYEAKKQKGISEFTTTKTREQKMKEQRDKIIHYLIKNKLIKTKDLSEMIRMSTNTINLISREIEDAHIKVNTRDYDDFDEEIEDDEE